MMDKNRLQYIRQFVGLTPREMAKALNMSLRTYRGWENGRPIPAIGATAVSLLYYMNPIDRADWFTQRGVH